MIRFFPFEMYHARKDIGSTRLRVHNLIKYWPAAGLYKYGENPDVLIFQKVYITQDYKFPKYFKGLKILDICDPDWLQGSSIKETLDAMDGVTCPTESLKEFLVQMTDKPIMVIPDRHDLEPVPPLKVHKGEGKKAVWFGYKQNAELLRFVIPSLESRGISLTIISNEDPMPWRWADNPEKYRDQYTFVKYDEKTIYKELRKSDFCVFPQGYRAQDMYKSNNKTTKSWLAGLPVAVDSETLEKCLDPAWRNEEAKRNYDVAIKEYNVEKSVEEMKQFIDQLKTEHPPLPYSPVSPSSSVKTEKLDPIAE